MPKHQNNEGKKPNKKLTYKQKSSIRYVDESDPPFIRAMKEKLGYQEPTVEDKFNEQLDEDEQDPDDIRNMKESERPAVVVLNEGKDLTVEQLDEEVRKKLEEDDRKKIEEGRITFKKPTKRASEGDSGDKEGNKSDEKRHKAEVQKANSKLLSFGDEEEEE